jgi:hypothetical protein
MAELGDSRGPIEHGRERPIEHVAAFTPVAISAPSGSGVDP